MIQVNLCLTLAFQIRNPVRLDTTLNQNLHPFPQLTYIFDTGFPGRFWRMGRFSDFGNNPLKVYNFSRTNLTPPFTHIPWKFLWMSIYDILDTLFNRGVYKFWSLICWKEIWYTNLNKQMYYIIMKNNEIIII